MVPNVFGDVPSPITDITVGHPSGTVIEWDMDYNYFNDAILFLAENRLL